MIRMRYLCKNSLGLQHSVAPHFVNSSSSSSVSIRGLFSSTDIFFFSSHWVRHREVLVTNHMIFESKNRLVLSNTFILIKFITIIVIIYSIIETVWFSTSNFGVHKNIDLKKKCFKTMYTLPINIVNIRWFSGEHDLFVCRTMSSASKVCI